ncbi:collagen, type I, alpha 1b-like [Bos indicus]|uniref:Collagen, type I, alpha 1b-like n=1 Tax=Bos indicus TaxID=9915 RepID=A0ABM4SA11_BOSIN
MVSGGRLDQWLRRGAGGPHGRGEEPGPRGSAHGARGARSPARARSLNSTARSSRAAVPQAVRSWQRRRAGALGVPLPHLESPGLSRPPAVSSSGVFLPFGGRASSPESAFSKPREWPRAQGSRRRRGARGPPGGAAVGPPPGARCPVFRRLGS